MNYYGLQTVKNYSNIDLKLIIPELLRESIVSNLQIKEQSINLSSTVVATLILEITKRSSDQHGLINLQINEKDKSIQTVRIFIVNDYGEDHVKNGNRCLIMYSYTSPEKYKLPSYLFISITKYVTITSETCLTSS